MDQSTEYFSLLCTTDEINVLVEPSKTYLWWKTDRDFIGMGNRERVYTSAKKIGKGKKTPKPQLASATRISIHVTLSSLERYASPSGSRRNQRSVS